MLMLFLQAPPMQRESWVLSQPLREIFSFKGRAAFTSLKNHVKIRSNDFQYYFFFFRGLSILSHLIAPNNAAARQLIGLPLFAPSSLHRDAKLY